MSIIILFLFASSIVVGMAIVDLLWEDVRQQKKYNELRRQVGISERPVEIKIRRVIK